MNDDECLREFDELLLALKSRNPWIQEIQDDSPSASRQIEYCEETLGVTFPRIFTSFLLRFGGGNVGYAVIYSTNENSPYSIVERNVNDNLIARGYLSFSDDGFGNRYCFRVLNGAALDEVYYWDHDQDTFELNAEHDFLSFAIREVLEH